jgi:hypothetical protein
MTVKKLIFNILYYRFIIFVKTCVSDFVKIYILVYLTKLIDIT